ncbi:hypothetical protein ACMYR3_03695 [Ampullimonas aquatilis]|uniref:hypothetical protein n=1 Tax=Ampullimonas aquatilis TaxID=1341549 RepID=UPI003C715D96
MSNAISLDFHQKQQPSLVIVAVLLLLTVIVFGLLAWSYQNDQDEIEGYQEKLSRLEKLSQVKKATVKSDKQDEKIVKNAKRIYDELTIPWSGLFDRFESVSLKDKISLISLTPVPNTQSVKIIGEAKNINDAIDYLGELCGKSDFRHCHLDSYQNTEKEALALTEFSAIVQW